MAKANPEDGEEKSLAQINREIAELDLQTKRLNYDEAKKRNELFLQAEDQRRRGNRQRQAELAQIRAAREQDVAGCRHKSGGSPRNIFRGGGIGSFSLITRALMPDAVTVLLQCGRCRMAEHYRLLSAAEEEKLSPKEHKRYLRNQKFYETSIDLGLEHAELRGPTFLFQRDGVPIVPVMV